MTEPGPQDGRQQDGRQQDGRPWGWIVFWALAGLVTLALVGGFATVLTTAKTYQEQSRGMEGTLRPGDILVAERTTQIRRGDVVIEQQPSTGPGRLDRRVIGLPGDHVACCDARGRVTVNGKPLDESYVYPGEAPSQARFHATVPAGHLWLMGDHRLISYDSQEPRKRSWR